MSQGEIRYYYSSYRNQIYHTSQAALTAFVWKLGTIDSCDQALEQLPWLDD
ncbi:hypothetical protein [Streptococcus ruminantium]|uniref:hypothetical protein n=1 Tax=Streptococcus ruminantium TaxID=1917441 RepID=UPI0012DE95DE|nr:hypothetical protein [Streptococcus ruminantium]